MNASGKKNANTKVGVLWNLVLYIYLAPSSLLLGPLLLSPKKQERPAMECTSHHHANTRVNLATQEAIFPWL